MFNENMKKLDIYIIKKYLVTFFFVLLIISAIAVVVDLSDKIKEFMTKPVTMQQIVVDYYLSFLLFINGLLLPLYVLIAVIFFTSRMASNSEIISILNAGVSFKRILLPFLIAAGFITGLHLVSNHLLIPIGEQSRISFENNYVWEQQKRVNDKDIHMFLAPGEKVYVRFYRQEDTTVRDIRLEHFEHSELTRVVEAKSGKFKGYPDKWELKNYEIRTFDGMNETLIMGKNKTIDTTFNLRPEDFIRYDNQKQTMTTPTLRNWINTEKDRGLGNTKNYEIEILQRTARPIAILILTIIGMSIAARKVRGGLGLHIALGIGIGAIYVVLIQFSTVFANSGSLSPIVGVWLPNIIFGIVAAYLWSTAQK